MRRVRDPAPCDLLRNRRSGSPLGFDAVLRILPVLAAAISLAACGDEERRQVTLALDFQPNAVHAGIYAAPGNDLEGRRVGVTGLPSDDAVLRAVVEDDGGDFDRVERVTIGFSAVPSLIAERVGAAVSFWDAGGGAVREQGV